MIKSNNNNITKQLQNMNKLQYQKDKLKQIINQNKNNIKQAIKSPNAEKALQKYYIIKNKLFDYFFKRQPAILKIHNKQSMQAYTDIFNILTQTYNRFAEKDKKYQAYQETFLKQYRKDLTQFCNKIKQQIIKQSKIHKNEQFIEYLLEWFYKYTRFMHSLLNVFFPLQKTSLHVKGTSLYYQGLKIFKISIEDIYQQLFTAIYQCLQMYKKKQLKSITPLKQIIKIIRIIGSRKHSNIILEKQDEKFIFTEKKSKGYNKELQLKQENIQNSSQNEFFERKFLKTIISKIKQKYQSLSNDLLKLSTSDYVNHALQILKIQQQIADIFYPYKKVKNVVIKSLQQILAHDKAQIIIKKSQSGLFSMLQRQQLKQAKKLLQLINRSSNIKIFIKEYQRFIQSKGQQILDKVSQEDQRTAKKQAVNQMIDDLYKLYELIQRITLQVANNDTQIQTCQTYGFQQICNKGEKVCNFLVYYADNALKKQQDSMNQMSDLTMKISKISKYLYSYDAFIKLYQRLLGIRMLYDNYKKRQIQENIINLLKNQAGVSTLNKISCMVVDYKFSEQFNNQKGPELRKQLGFNLQVMVLTSGSWQIHDAKNGNSCVPEQLKKASIIFQQIYNKKLPDRTLTWAFNYGRAIVLAHFDNQAKHVLIINNYQLCILLYLQRTGFKQSKLSQLLHQLKIDDQPAFTASLMMLLKQKIILKQGNQAKFQSKNESISYNMKFKHHTQKVKCFQNPKYIQRGNTQTGQLILERSHLVDAAIVKIMKSKRIVQYSELISQVQKMCKTFKAEVVLIKKRIQNCQQRDFLERDSEDMNKLIYIP